MINVVIERFQIFATKTHRNSIDLIVLYVDVYDYCFCSSCCSAAHYDAHPWTRAQLVTSEQLKPFITGIKWFLSQNEQATVIVKEIFRSQQLSNNPVKRTAQLQQAFAVLRCLHDNEWLCSEERINQNTEKRSAEDEELHQQHHAQLAEEEKLKRTEHLHKVSRAEIRKRGVDRPISLSAVLNNNSSSSSSSHSSSSLATTSSLLHSPAISSSSYNSSSPSVNVTTQPLDAESRSVVENFKATLKELVSGQGSHVDENLKAFSNFIEELQSAEDEDSQLFEKDFSTWEGSRDQNLMDLDDDEEEVWDVEMVYDVL